VKLLADEANQFEVNEMATGVKARKAAKTACAKTPISLGASRRSACSSPIAKNISLFQKIKSGVWCAHPATTRGAYRDRHGRRQRDAVDEGCTLDERRNSRMVKSRGPDLPTLGSSSPVMTASDGGYQARHSGESAYKP
jgi:hypothetical protein